MKNEKNPFGSMLGSDTCIVVAFMFTLLTVALCLLPGCKREGNGSQSTVSPANSAWDENAYQKAKDEAMAEARREDQAREAGLLQVSNQIHLPNYQTGPGRPPPDYVNFYDLDDRSPMYLLCEYPINANPYDRSQEAEWFRASLEQIRKLGTNKFPPISWVAVCIRNNAEFKGAGTFEQCYKVGSIFNASNVFDSSRDLAELVDHADMDRHPFVYDRTQLTPGDQQRWVIVERHVAAHQSSTNSLK